MKRIPKDTKQILMREVLSDYEFYCFKDGKPNISKINRLSGLPKKYIKDELDFRGLL